MDNWGEVTKLSASNEIEAALDEIGFVWGTSRTKKSPQDRIEELRAYNEQYGNFNVPRGSEKYPGLAKWLANHKRRKK